MQQSQDLSQAFISNLSLSQYSWEKQKRFTTDEDVLCSYSKLSNVSPIKESTKSKGKQFNNQNGKLEESINLEDKDDKIKKLQEYQTWLQEQNEKLMVNQQLIIEEQAQIQKKQDYQVQDLQSQIILVEQQLQKSLKNLGYLEKENANLKTKLIDQEKKMFETQNLKQEYDLLKSKLQEQESNFNHKVQEYQKYCAQQVSHINKLEKELQMSRKNSKELINKQYKSAIIKEKSPQHYDQVQQVKFVECIVDMVMNCTPNASVRPSLKKCWKWLKNILEDYMALKKSASTKNSQLVDRKRDNSSFFNEVNRRFQTSYEDSENKFLRSNTLLTKLQR